MVVDQYLEKGIRLIRPAQNCFPDYGTSLVFNKIEVLSPDEFKESLVGELKPSENSIFKGNPYIF